MRSEVFHLSEESQRILDKFIDHTEAYITYANNKHLKFHRVKFSEKLEDATLLCKIRCIDQEHAIDIINKFADEYCGDDKIYGYCWVAKDNIL